MTDASKTDQAAPGQPAEPDETKREDSGTPAEAVEETVRRLEADLDRRTAVVKALRPLARSDAFTDLKKLRGRLEKLEYSLDEEQVATAGIADLLESLRAFQRTAGQKRRKELGRELKAACEKAGLPIKVISREEPVEIRVQPLAVVLDFDKGLADIRFARQSIVQCGATVADILDGHARALGSLESAFDPEIFFEDCLTAYRMSLVATGRKRGDRVELNDFIANLALRRQSKKFHEDPTASHYRGYSRAQLAYDVLRLRKSGKLTQGGRRINFGVATGTTATKKSRVLYMEDEAGKGEYKLTVYFTEPGS